MHILQKVYKTSLNIFNFFLSFFTLLGIIFAFFPIVPKKLALSQDIIQIFLYDYIYKFYCNVLPIFVMGISIGVFMVYLIYRQKIPEKNLIILKMHAGINIKILCPPIILFTSIFFISVFFQYLIFIYQDTYALYFNSVSIIHTMIFQLLTGFVLSLLTHFLIIYSSTIMFGIFNIIKKNNGII